MRFIFVLVATIMALQLTVTNSTVIRSEEGSISDFPPPRKFINQIFFFLYCHYFIKIWFSTPKIKRQKRRKYIKWDGLRFFIFQKLGILTPQNVRRPPQTTTCVFLGRTVGMVDGDAMSVVKRIMGRRDIVEVRLGWLVGVSHRSKVIGTM